MTQFIHTGRGYRRLADVKLVKIADDSTRSLLGENGEKIGEHGDVVEEHIVSIIPITGEWEQVYVREVEGGGTEVTTEPVIAWGLTAVGSVIPVTPTAPQGLPYGAALRKVGRPQIYVSSSTYDNEEHWLKSSDA